MRFLGYTLANEAETPTEPPRPRAVREDGHIRRGGDKGRRHRRHRAASLPPPRASRSRSTTVSSPSSTGRSPRRRSWSAGWALMECRDLPEAVEWSKRFLSVLGEGEVRVRPVS